MAKSKAFHLPGLFEMLFMLSGILDPWMWPVPKYNQTQSSLIVNCIWQWLTMLWPLVNLCLKFPSDCLPMLNAVPLTCCALCVPLCPGGLSDWHLLGPHQHCPQVDSAETGPRPDFSPMERGLGLGGCHTRWGGICGGRHHAGSLPWQTEGKENRAQTFRNVKDLIEFFMGLCFLCFLNITLQIFKMTFRCFM